MAVFLSPIGNGAQYFTIGGLPANGGFLKAYQAGTTTPQATFTTSAGNVANPVSIPLGVDGRPPAGIWLTSGIAYDFILTDSSGAQVGPPMLNITGIGDGSTPAVNLASSSGSSMVGNGTETVADSFNALQFADYAALRAYAGPRKSVYVTGYLVSAAPSGIAGMFVRDDNDTTSADNGGTIIVTAGSKRYKRADPTVSVKHFGAVGDGVANDSVAVQAAIDVMAAREGGLVFVPPGTYKGNFILKSGVVLSSLMSQYGYLPSNLSSATFLQAAAGFVLDTPAGGIGNCGVQGINFKGLGAATAGGGVRFQNVSWGIIKGCQFDNFADQAVLKLAGNANTFEDILTTNTLLNRVRTVPNGCVELAGGADDFLNRIEANPSLTAISDINLRVCGIVVAAANVFASNCIGEFSDYGIYSTGTSGRYVNCRSDLNRGHGFYVAGDSLYSNCLALNNGSVANTYDGFVLNNVQGTTLTGCKATGTHRYAFNDNANYAAVASRNNFVGCTGAGYQTALYSLQSFLGSSPIEAGHPVRDGTATPDMTGSTMLVCTHTGATTITDFLGGYSGKTLRILGNAFVTIANNANITTNTGANKALAAGKIYTFTWYSGWFENA